MNLQQLPEALRISRECALLGRYDEAITHHSSAMKQIKLHLQTVSDSASQNMWMKVSMHDLAIESIAQTN